MGRAEKDVEKTFWLNWITQHTHQNAALVSQEELGFYLYDAEINMYAEAADHFSFNGSDSLFSTLRKDPTKKWWSHCGDAVDLFASIARVLDIPVRQINFLSTANDGHSMIEVFSKKRDRWILLDPFYAATVLSPLDQELGALDLEHLLSIQRGPLLSGFKVHRFGIKTPWNGKAVSPEWQGYLNRTYDFIIANYLNYLVIRTEDTTAQGTFLPGNKPIKGRWLVFNNMPNTQFLTGPAAKQDWNLFLFQNSVTQSGNYEITSFVSNTLPTKSY